MSVAHPTQIESDDAKLRDAGTSNGQLVLRLLKLTWQYRLHTLRLLFTQAIMLVMMLTGLGFIGIGIDTLRYHVQLDDEPATYPFGFAPPESWAPITTMAFIAGTILAVASARFVLDRLNTIWKMRLVQDVVVHMRTEVYDKLQRLSFRFFDANESGSIINRVTGDVQAVRRFIDGVMVEVLMLALSLAFFLGYMLSVHVPLTLACLATTPLLWVLTAMFSRLVKPAYRRNRELFDQTLRVLQENVQAIHVIKGFWRQDAEIEKFRQANAAVRDQKQWIIWQVSIFSPLIAFIPHLNMVVLVIYGGWLFMQGEIALGTGLVVFARLLQEFSTKVGNIAQIANAMQQSLIGAQRVFEVMDAPVEIATPTNPVPLPRAEGRVAFENVTYAYSADDEPALENVTFEAQPHQCVAILGATGAGKSTLLSLIPRFYDPQQGRVLVDGVDVREYDLDDLRRNIGIVFQESFLFSTTVAQNIAFGHPEATREQIEKAARIAAAHEFIMEMEHGYDTIVGERGTNLSGGQRQRLAIARAVLLEPSILLLDDPTAAIDPETEHEILMAMDNAMEGRTTFVVAHRLSTLRRADYCIVLEDGQIVQQGTHEELMNTKGHYRRAARLQIADEESKRLLGMESTA